MVKQYQTYKVSVTADDSHSPFWYGLDSPVHLGIQRLVRPSHDKTKPHTANLCTRLQSPPPITASYPCWKDDSGVRHQSLNRNITEARTEKPHHQ